MLLSYLTVILQRMVRDKIKPDEKWVLDVYLLKAAIDLANNKLKSDWFLKTLWAELHAHHTRLFFDDPDDSHTYQHGSWMYNSITT